MLIIILRFQGKIFFFSFSLSFFFFFFLTHSLSFGFLSFISPMLHNEITLEYFYKSYYYWIILKKIQNENSLLTNYYDFRALILFLNGTSWKAKKIILYTHSIERSMLTDLKKVFGNTVWIFHMWQNSLRYEFFK